MFGIATKKGVEKSFEKVKKDIENHKEKIARLEGAITILSNSHSQPLSPIIKHSQKQKGTIEDIAINKFKRAKKPEVMERIKQLLLLEKSVVDIREDLVDRQKLIPQATFYRYVKKIQSENDNEKMIMKQLNKEVEN